MSELERYLNGIINTSYFPVSFCGDDPAVLNRWLVKLEPERQYLPYDLCPYLDSGPGSADPVSAGKQSGTAGSSNWDYYLSDSRETLYSLSHPETIYDDVKGKFIYSLCNVYCEEAHENLVYVIYYIAPFRLWINGRIAAVSNVTYAIRPVMFLFPFRKGNNTVLVERAGLVKDWEKNIYPQSFTFIVKPLDFLLGKRLKPFFDEDLIRELSGSYTIAMDKALYGEDDRLQLVVFPRRFGQQEERVKISMYDTHGERLDGLDAFTGTAVSINGGKAAKGVLRIKAEDPENPERFSEAYVYRGAFARDRKQLIQKVQARPDCSIELLETMKQLVRIPDYCNSCVELAQEILYTPLFMKYTECAAYAEAADNKQETGVLDVFKQFVILYKKNEIDDNIFPYFVSYPQDYCPGRAYPLIISVQFGYALSTYPRVMRYIKSGKFRDFIVVSICARGEFSTDYIYEGYFTGIINDVIERFHIIRDKIYLIGSSASALMGFDLALKFPDLFAAVVNIEGMLKFDFEHSDYDLLKNLDNTVIYNICSVEDKIYNTPTVLNILSMCSRKLKNRAYHYFIHDELNDLFNTGKIAEALLGEQRVKYPARVRFVTYYPLYNKAYWIKIGRICDLNQKAWVNAEITAGGGIHLEMGNIDSLFLFLDAALMNLDDNPLIRFNGHTQSIKPGKYSVVEIAACQEPFVRKVKELTQDEFNLEYNAVTFRQELLGIRQVYCKKCVIITPDTVLDGKLLYLLQNPIKNRARNYHYPLLDENKVNGETLHETNFVSILDLSCLTDEQKSFLEKHNIEADKNSVAYNCGKYTGSCFALIKVKSFFNPLRQGLFVLYSDLNAKEELIKLLETFDYNPVFYHEAVVYHNCEYAVFRDLS